MLVSHAEYKTLIHDNIKDGHVQPPLWDRASGKPACMRWHYRQVCTLDCPHAATHTQPLQFATRELERVHAECKGRTRKRPHTPTQQDDRNQGNDLGLDLHLTWAHYTSQQTTASRTTPLHHWQQSSLRIKPQKTPPSQLHKAAQ
eukprot:9232216-Ditylum_brightwellii.AAC.1